MLETAVASVSGWLTPNALFLLLNLVIATVILISSSAAKHAFARSPSIVLYRLRFFNLRSRCRRTPADSVTLPPPDSPQCHPELLPAEQPKRQSDARPAAGETPFKLVTTGPNEYVKVEAPAVSREEHRAEDDVSSDDTDSRRGSTTCAIKIIIDCAAGGPKMEIFVDGGTRGGNNRGRKGAGGYSDDISRVSGSGQGNKCDSSSSSDEDSCPTCRLDLDRGDKKTTASRTEQGSSTDEKCGAPPPPTNSFDCCMMGRPQPYRMSFMNPPFERPQRRPIRNQSNWKNLLNHT